MANNREKCRYRTKIVKDVVHQFVELPSDFFDTAVDTLTIQRLRDIKQLSLAHLVYPGAVHNRFEHSLGVAHVMKMAIEHLARNIQEHVVPSLEKYRKDPALEALAKGLASFLKELAVKLVELTPVAVTAALYHDSGHIALSHPGEDALRDPLLYFSPDREVTVSELSIEGFDHESLGLSLVASRADCIDKGRCPEVRYACESVDLKRVAAILDKAYNKDSWSSGCEPVMFRRTDAGKLLPEYEADRGNVERVAECIIASLLSGPIDVDRADYILRDTVHTGSRSGVWDINRYYSVLTVVPRITSSLSGEEYRVSIGLGVLDKGVSVVENILLSRIYMYGDVYLHDISMIYSNMASRTLALLYSIGRYLLKDLEDGEERARDLLEKYPVLEALANLPARARPLIGGEYRDMERDLAYLTDTPVMELVTRLGLGRARDLLDYILWKADASARESQRGWFRNACASLVLAARGLIYRRHWHGIILADERATTVIERLKGSPQEVNAVAKNILERCIDPLFIIGWNRYVPYKSEGRDKIYVFRRRNPLEPHELSKAPEAKVVDKIAGTSYSKFVIVVPDLKMEPPTPGWYTRRGKLLREDYEVASRTCGYSDGELRGVLEEVGKRSLRMASELLELA
ncbi:MAG: hypothetical protein F7C38_04860 [Desulfurococcales archaeon]|nr:hypothetical protein [Desulfurococcales archaeon]